MSVLVLSMLLFQDPVQEPQRPVEKPRPQEKEVVIIGQRRESDILDVPSAVTVIEGEKIRESGVTNIKEVIQTVPGFFAQSQNKSAHDAIIDLRGFNNGGGNGQRTLVLVDGRKTNGVTTSATDWATIPLENIERVEVVRGPAAALYGDTAMAGVINIITKKGAKEFASQGSAAGGNWGTYRVSAGAGGSQGDILYDLFAGTEGTQGYRDHSDYRGTNATGRVESPLNDSLRFFAKAGYHEDTRERPGTLTKTEIAAFGRKTSLRPGNAGAQEGYGDAGLVQSLGTLGDLSLFLNYTQGSTFFRDDSFAFESDDDFDIGTLQLKHVVSPTLFGRPAVFTSGLDLSYETAVSEGGDSFGTSNNEYRRRLMGLYEHVEIRPLTFVVVSASLRYDRALLDLDRDLGGPFPFGDNVDDQRAFDQLSPHAGVTFKILEELSLFAGWARTFKYPTRDELIGTFAGDPQLKPERSHVIEAGVRGRAGSWASAGVSYYRMEVKDEIFLDTSLGPPFGMNFNFEEVTHQGVESEGRLSPWGWMELYATHTFTRAVVTDSTNPAQEGKYYPVTPRMAGTVGVVFRYEGAALTLGGRYAGDRYLVNDVENQQEKLPPYFVYDARVAYSYKALTAFIAVYNVTDREYYDNGGMSLFTGNLQYNPAPERSWLVGGEVRF